MKSSRISEFLPGRSGEKAEDEAGSDSIDLVDDEEIRRLLELLEQLDSVAEQADVRLDDNGNGILSWSGFEAGVTRGCVDAEFFTYNVAMDADQLFGDSEPLMSISTLQSVGGVSEEELRECAPFFGDVIIQLYNRQLNIFRDGDLERAVQLVRRQYISGSLRQQGMDSIEPLENYLDSMELPEAPDLSEQVVREDLIHNGSYKEYRARAFAEYKREAEERSTSTDVRTTELNALSQRTVRDIDNGIRWVELVMPAVIAGQVSRLSATVTQFVNAKNQYGLPHETVRARDMTLSEIQMYLDTGDAPGIVSELAMHPADFLRKEGGALVVDRGIQRDHLAQLAATELLPCSHAYRGSTWDRTVVKTRVSEARVKMGNELSPGYRYDHYKNIVQGNYVLGGGQ